MTNLIEYKSASNVYNDIRTTFQTEYINNFWKDLANHPHSLRRTWETLKEVMGGEGEIDPLTRELIYIAVSITNGCEYCIASHTAADRAKGATEKVRGELLAIVAAANSTNRLTNDHQVPVDEQFKI